MWSYIYTRPDLGFLVLTFSCFFLNPIQKHFSKAKKVYRYLQKTKDYKQVYCGDLKNHITLKINMDAD